MAIQMQLAEDTYVYLGEIKERLLADLDLAKVEYSVPFDKTNRQNIRETIITIKDMDIEISVENDIITYIKSGENVYSHVDVVESIDTDVLNHIVLIQKQISDKVNSSGEYDMRVEKIDTKTLQIVVILSSEYEKARLIVARDGNGNVYINTLRRI